jgi:hypothetical protein
MKKSLLFYLLLVVTFANAQSEFSSYRLNGTLPESNLLNPAFAPNFKVVIGLPVISSLYFSGNTGGLSFRDVFKPTENDSLKLDTLSIFQKLKPSNGLTAKESIQLFYFGLRGKKGYFSFGVHQVSETRFNYPGDLVGWAIRGPGSSHYIGKPLDFSNFYGSSVWYNKISFNYGRDITNQLRIGVRVNYLLGVASGQTTKLSGKLYVGIDSVNVRTGAIKLETAGYDFFNKDNLSGADYQNYFLKSKNKGVSIDIGGTYSLTDNITLSAAINDLGSIKWKDYTRAYDIAPVNYTFKGFDFLDYINKKPGDQFLQAQADSLQNLYKAKETKGNTFKTSLVGKFYAGANIRVLRINNFSALVYMDMFRKKISPAISLGYNLQLGRTLNTTVGISFANGKISNIGAGIALKLTHMQFYASSDRANSFAYPARASSVDARFGMNLVFGKAKKKDKIDEALKEEKEKPKEEIKEEAPPIIKEEPVEKKDSVVAAPVITPAETVVAPIIQPLPLAKDTIPTIQPKPDTARAEVIAPPPAIVEPVKEVVVHAGNAKDELTVSHYIIVGAFRSKENAKRYSDQLKKEGHDNQFGFVTEKSVYYVYLKKIDDRDEAIRIRTEYRAKTDFEFPNAWILTVEK